MKAFWKVALACALFLALANSAFATGAKAPGRAPRPAGNGVISLAEANDNIPGVPIPASPVAGTLDESAEWSDVYAIHLNAGEVLNATLQGDGGTDFDLFLYAPGSTSVEVNEPVAEASSDSYPDTFSYPVPFSGTYYLEAYAYSGTGAYAITYSVTPVSPVKPVFRFFNKKNGSHFYTQSLDERYTVITTLGATYSLDGVAYYVNTLNPLNNSPLYRFYNKKNGSHFYTASLAEKNSVQANLSATYAYDGPAYNVCKTPGGTLVWRFYNKTNGSHFYTASLAEKNTVVRNTLGNIYALDGPAFYIAP